MSVILFSKAEAYQKIANAYAGLRYLLLDGNQDERDQEFYDSLCYLSYANIAAWLATYAKGDDRDHALAGELQDFEFLTEIKGVRPFGVNLVRDLAVLTSEWRHLQYNLVTNGGEMYIPRKAFDFVQSAIERLVTVVAEKLAEAQGRQGAA